MAIPISPGWWGHLGRAGHGLDRPDGPGRALDQAGPAGGALFRKSQQTLVVRAHLPGPLGTDLDALAAANAALRIVGQDPIFIQQFGPDGAGQGDIEQWPDTTDIKTTEGIDQQGAQHGTGYTHQSRCHALAAAHPRNPLRRRQ